METILNKYRTEIAFTEKELENINLAFENGMISTDEVIEDWFKYRDRELQKYEYADDELLFSFNEHYNNGLTHTQNFINLIKFLK